MTSRVKANRILEKWKVDYVSMDKKAESISDNFHEFFYALYCAAIPWDIARDMADAAIAHHLPSTSTAKYVYNIKKRFTKLQYKDWLDSWKENIRHKGMTVFYELYPLEDQPDKPVPNKRVSTNSKTSTLKGIKSDDDLNSEDFYKSSKVFSLDNPFPDVEGK